MKINYAILRYFNVCGSSPSGKIGLMAKTDSLFKNISIAIMKKKPLIQIYGNDYNTPDGTTIRDYIHVSDLADIHLKSLEYLFKNNKSEIFNCGYGKGYSIKEVVECLNDLVETNINVEIGPRRSGDSECIVSNPGKFIKAMSWKPKFNDLRYIIKSAIAWEKKLN